MPEICSSIGSMISRSTFRATRRDTESRPTTIGGDTSGNSSVFSATSEKTPKTTSAEHRDDRDDRPPYGKVRNEHGRLLLCCLTLAEPDRSAGRHALRGTEQQDIAFVHARQSSTRSVCSSCSPIVTGTRSALPSRTRRTHGIARADSPP